MLPAISQAPPLSKGGGAEKSSDHKLNQKRPRAAGCAGVAADAFFTCMPEFHWPGFEHRTGCWDSLSDCWVGSE